MNSYIILIRYHAITNSPEQINNKTHGLVFLHNAIHNRMKSEDQMLPNKTLLIHSFLIIIPW